MSKKSVFDVACLGTSLTTGRLSGDWVRLMETWLAQVADRPVRTYDMGQGSSTSASWGIPNSQLVAGLKAKVVTIEFDINDCVPANSITQSQSHANYTTIVNTIRAENPTAQIFLMSMNPVSAAGVSGRPDLETRYSALSGLATTLGCGFINNRALFGTNVTTESTDGLHLTEAAAQTILLPNIFTNIKAYMDTLP